jgi:hypothetical protein
VTVALALAAFFVFAAGRLLLHLARLPRFGLA